MSQKPNTSPDGDKSRVTLPPRCDDGRTDWRCPCQHEEGRGVVPWSRHRQRWEDHAAAFGAGQRAGPGRGGRRRRRAFAAAGRDGGGHASVEHRAHVAVLQASPEPRQTQLSRPLRKNPFSHIGERNPIKFVETRKLTSLLASFPPFSLSGAATITTRSTGSATESLRPVGLSRGMSWAHRPTRCAQEARRRPDRRPASSQLFSKFDRRRLEFHAHTQLIPATSR